MLYTMNYHSSAFFTGKKIGCLSCICITVFFHLFLMQKVRKRRLADMMADMTTNQTLKEFSSVDIQTTGVAEE